MYGVKYNGWQKLMEYVMLLMCRFARLIINHFTLITNKSVLKNGQQINVIYTKIRTSDLCPLSFIRQLTPEPELQLAF